MSRLTATTIKAAYEPGRFGYGESSSIFTDTPHGSLISSP